MATHSEHGQRPAVIATPGLELWGLAGADEADLVQVATCLLDPDDAWQLRASNRGRRGHVHRGPADDVGHNRGADFGDRLEVLVHAFLRTLAVVGHDGEPAVRSGFHRALREPDRATCVVAP